MFAISPYGNSEMFDVGLIVDRQHQKELLTVAADAPIHPTICDALCLTENSNMKLIIRHRGKLVPDDNMTFADYRITQGAHLSVELAPTSGVASLAADALCQTSQKLGPGKADMLCSNVILSGGGSMFEGLDVRLQNELQREMALRMHHPGTPVRVIAAPERKILPWIGGSIMSSLTNYAWGTWIPKEAGPSLYWGGSGPTGYEDVGPSIVDKKWPVNLF